MSSLNWNALWILAAAGIIGVLPFVSFPTLRPRAAPLLARSSMRRNRRRRPGEPE